MKAMVVVTGVEILNGDVVNTNAAWMAEKLSELGVDVVRHVSVGDEREDIRQALESCAGRCDMTLVTGGLGPTKDDCTTEAAALCAGVSLKEDSQAKASVDAYFKGRKVVAPASNHKQALLPEGARCLTNPVGTAPGFCLTLKGTRFWFFPGVPREMKHLMREVVLPEIGVLLSEGTRLFKARFMTFGLPESVVGERLSDFSSLFPNVCVGFRARFPVIEVKLWVFERELHDEWERACAEAKKRLGDYLFSDSGSSLPETLAGFLSTEGKTLAVAESCTGGLVGSLLTDVAGSSDWFLLSAVTYANSAKMGVLGVKKETLASFGAVSEETAAEMAEGVRRASGADIGLATSGIAGPGGGSDEKPVGTLCLGLATDQGTQTLRFVSPFKERHQNKRIFAFKALDLLRRSML